MNRKAILLLFCAFVLFSCIFNNGNVQGDIYVYETTNWYDAQDSLRESTQYTADGMSIIGQVVGEEYPESKITYDANGNMIEFIAYDEYGQQRTRRINSYLEYRPGIYVRGNYSVYNANDSLRFSGYFDLDGNTRKFRIGDESYYRSYFILDEHGNDIEIIEFNTSGDTIARFVYTYQLLIDDVYVIASSESYDENDNIVRSTTNTLDGLSLFTRETDSDHIDAKTTFNNFGKMIETIFYNSTGGQAQRNTYTYQLLNP